MRIAKLIEELQKIQKENGNLEVCVLDTKNNHFRFVSGVYLQEVPSYSNDGFFIIQLGKER